MILIAISDFKHNPADYRIVAYLNWFHNRLARSGISNRCLPAMRWNGGLSQSICTNSNLTPGSGSSSIMSRRYSRSLQRPSKTVKSTKHSKAASRTSIYREKYTKRWREISWTKKYPIMIPIIQLYDFLAPDCCAIIIA